MDSRPGSKNNAEIKAAMRKHGITYKMLAESTEYSCNTITKIMGEPLLPWYERRIRQAIDRIIENGTPAKQCLDLIKQMKLYGISYTEVAMQIGIPRSKLWYWLNKGKASMSAQRCTAIEQAITKIREERRLNYESD